MRDTVPINASEIHQRTKFTVKLTCRKLMDGDVAKDFQRIAWLLAPRHIPKADIGKRRRKGHFSSSGRADTSDSCRE